MTTASPYNVERVAIALCSWLNGRKRQMPADEIWLGISEFLKDQYRDQARSAIAAMPQQPVELQIGATAIMGEFMEHKTAWEDLSEGVKGHFMSQAQAAAEAWGLRWEH